MKLCPKCGKQFPDDANFCPVDAARLNAAEVAPAAASNLDDFDQRFELQARLGGATTGPVWKALDRSTGRVVALKLVAPEVTALPSIGAKIERELRQLERVESTGIVRVLASGKKGEQVWIATEYLDGAQTLAQAIGARGPIDAASAGRLVEMIGEALIEAAKAGVVHRDLAPKNILFAGDQVRLINFCVPTAGPSSDKCPGVPEYVAPECVEGKPLDQRSNIYSLGAIHYYALTSQAPIDGDAASVFRAKIEGTIPPPSGRGVPVAGDVDVLVKRALDRSPSKRFLTVRQYLDEIVRVASGGAPEPGATLPAGSRSRPQAAELVRTLTGLPAGFGVTPALDAAVHGGQVVISPASIPPTGPVVELGTPKANPGGTLQLGGSEPVVAPAPSVAPAVTAPLGIGAVAAAHAAVDATAPLGNAALPAAPAAPQPPLASPVMPAGPILSSPAALAAAAAATGKKKGEEDGGSKGKFRETLWFKKGELDVAAAEAAAAAAAAGKEAGADKADSRPMEDRYNDDGTISRADRDKYSLKTGGTQMMAAIKAPVDAGASNVSERELVGEMKGGRSGVIIGIIVMLLVVGGLIFWLATR